MTGRNSKGQTGVEVRSAETRSASVRETGPVLTDPDFVAIATLLRRETGINLSQSKRDLVQGRLGRRLRALRIDSFHAYLERVTAIDGAEERRQMINALTTNLTGFFRESHHFDYLAEVVFPAVAARSNELGRRLRIWSAGCSSGEEPYSIAMTLCARMAGLAQWDARILATDIDSEMVLSGRTGRFPAAKGDSIPPSFRKRFMQPADHGEALVVSEALRSLVTFKELNLLGAWPMRGPFDIIFCRNVAIYFDKQTQGQLYDRFADLLRPGGWLFVGHSESLFRLSERYDHLGRTAYRRRP